MELMAKLLKELDALEGLSDLGLTLFIAEKGLFEAGFSFRTVETGLATFEVPEQPCEDWYNDEGWPSEAKKTVATGVAASFGLQLYEPPDSYRKCVPGQAATHHHFEFFAEQDMEMLVAKVHPRYFQVRVSGLASGTDPDALFQKLSGFYT